MRKYAEINHYVYLKGKYYHNLGGTKYKIGKVVAIGYAYNQNKESGGRVCLYRHGTKRIVNKWKREEWDKRRYPIADDPFGEAFIISSDS